MPRGSPWFSLGNPWESVGISYQLLDLGDQDLKDPQNNVVGSFSVRDHLAIVSFGLQILPGLDAGLNFKVFQSRVHLPGAVH